MQKQAVKRMFGRQSKIEMKIMNKSIMAVSLSTVWLAISLISGCASAPTAAERAIANVQTNYVPALVLQTNVVTVVQTNTVIQTVTQTNSVGVPVPVFLTNFTSFTTYQTNVVMATNQTPVYILSPNTTATGAAQVAGTIANLAAPGTGTLVTGAVLGLLSIFLGWRNRQFAGQNTVLTQSAGVLAQTIEVGRELMSSTPQGQKAADAFTQWMVSHQAETNTIGQITQIVKDSTDNTQAQSAANQILALIGQPPTPAKPAA
jgi:hypothetical protein